MAVGAVAAVVVIVAVAVLRTSSTNDVPLDPTAARGKAVATEKGCLSCHSTTGNRSEGPTWKGLYGSTVQLTTGASVTVDDAYLTRAVREPQREVVAGFRAGMPAIPVNDDELAALIAYLEALR